MNRKYQQLKKNSNKIIEKMNINNKFRKSQKLSRVTITEQNYLTTEQKVTKFEKKVLTTDKKLPT